MSSLETTELKLKTTPTGGVSGEHSPYYRRLLSAGYKGFLQGTISGAGLYGFMGLVIGGLVAVPAMIMFPALGASAFLLVPAAGGVGLLKGASTFGNIGTVAAISAESADLAEQRRYLLDRYYDLPEGPAGDKEAAMIKQELENIQHTKGPHPLFHWKTVAICAAIGGLLALAFAFPPLKELVMHGPIAEVLEPLAHLSPALSHLTLAGIGSAIGALMGAVVGIDRHYIRKWFDGSEKILHDESHSQSALLERGQQVARLQEAAKQDNKTKIAIAYRNTNPVDLQAGVATMPPAPKARQPIASLDAQPDTLVRDAQYQQPMVDASKAAQVSAG